MSDTNAENRKKDHIELAFQSQVNNLANDDRFHYEPLLQPHPELHKAFKKNFLGKNMRLPVWISSMTGGTELAGTINKNLAKACNEFGMGMGLGSCRSLLYNDTYFDDFNLRPIIGSDLSFYANLGIAQIEKSLFENKVDSIKRLIDKLKADGLIIHVNPLQEFLQPEGDRFQYAPIDTIERFLSLVDFPLIVKEVGQGMGPESIRALLQMPIAAFEFAAYGGTNFSKVELLRSAEEKNTTFQALSYIGHTAEEMISFISEILNKEHDKIRCRQVIISGGIKNFVDGYYYTQKITTSSAEKINAIYAQGSAFLKHAQSSYDELKTYIESQQDGLALCEAYLKIKR